MRRTRRCSAWLFLCACALALAGCAKEQPPINRIGVNVVDKAVFEGSWYMSRTVVDVDYQGSALGTFPGDVASDAAQSFTAMPRIRWVIDENYIFAYRDYDLTLGGDGESKAGAAGAKDEASKKEAIGQPVAAFKVEKHFDIRRKYNPATGEEQNTIVENDKDKRWFERKYMRVDWSKNLLPGYYGQTYDLNELVGNWKREPTDLYVQSASVFPDAWQPRFDRMQCDGSKDKSNACKDFERDLADDYDKDELYHMSFVTQELLSPDKVPDPDTGQPVNWCGTRYSDAPTCTSVASYVRTSFLRVSDKRQYQPVNWVDSRFERFGFFRLEQSTYDRSTGAPDDPAFFNTDFLNYNVNRHNIWKRWWDKDKKPLPYRDRDVRQIVWYTTPELPAHLVRPAMDVVGEWNSVLMETVRHLRGEALPHYPDVACQEEDPDGYCYCQKDPESGKTIHPTCAGQYDPFKPADAYGEGVEDAYDCWIDVPDDAEPDMDGSGLGDADFNGWYGARFVGDECVSVLRVNACNRQSIADNDGKLRGSALSGTWRSTLQVPELRRPARHRLSRRRHAARRSGHGRAADGRRQYRRPCARQLPHFGTAYLRSRARHDRRARHHRRRRRARLLRGHLAHRSAGASALGLSALRCAPARRWTPRAKRRDRPPHAARAVAPVAAQGPRGPRQRLQRPPAEVDRHRSRAAFELGARGADRRRRRSGHGRARVHR